jgi:hypothetical protein
VKLAARVRPPAEGVDIDLLLSTDAALLRSKVRAVSLEVVGDDCTPLYEGQKRCGEVVEQMTRLGYRLKASRGANRTAQASCRTSEWYPRPEQQALRANCEMDFTFERVHAHPHSHGHAS